MSKLKSLFLLVIMTMGINTFLFAQENGYGHHQCRGFKTFTQGGWGTSCHGNNPGCYLQNNFAAAFPTGLIIGCTNQLKLTGYSNVVDFLPSGGAPSALPVGTLTNPGSAYHNVLAGQLVALTLNVKFDLYDPNFSYNADHLQDLIIAHGPFAGWTVAAFLTEANKVMGGCSTAYSFATLNSTASAINENFDNGWSNNGFLICRKLNVHLNITERIHCFGGTGSISSTVTGGTAPYTYLWSTGDTIPNLTNVPAGTYTLTVTDANGKTTTETITLTQPSQLILTTHVVNISCFGEHNGSASVHVTGGKHPYTYLWSTGSTNDSISGLDTGVYTVIITDHKGCKDTASVIITEPELLTAVASATGGSCAGNDGSASVVITGGTPPYTILWSNGETTAAIDSLVAGSYIVTVTDSNGCVASDTVSITPSGGLTLTTTSTDVTCFGENNGTASVTAIGGTLPYTYLWSNGGTTANIDSLSAGIYVVTVTDSNGCAGTDSVLISQPELLVAEASSTDVSCLGNNGSASVSITGGTTPYSILWSNGETAADIDSLTAGNYIVTVTDSNGCIASDTAVIAPSEALILTTTSTDVTCFGQSNGSASVAVTGGTLPYSFLWSNGETTADIDSLTAGIYVITVTDSVGCAAQDSVQINQPDQILLTVTSTEVTCNGDSSGTASVSITGGTPPYSILWSNGETTAAIDSLVAGSYVVTVTDSNGCAASDTAVIAPPSALILTTTSTDVTCFGGNNGSASVTVTGGVLPYAFLWSNGETTADIDSLTAGIYVITVTDSNGCSAADSVLIDEPDQILLEITSTDVTCNGDSNGTASVTITGGILPYSILWSNGSTAPDIDSLTAGLYTITVTDSNGCVAGDSVLISQPDPILLTITSTNVTCSGGNNGTASLTITGGIEPYTILWSNGSTSADIDSLTADTYTVTVTDSNGCVAIDSVLISEPEGLIATTSSTNVRCYGGNDGSASVTITGGTLPYSIIWSNGATTASIDSLTAGTYGVLVTDSAGCTVEGDSILITQPDQIVITLSSTPVTCGGGGNDGTATVSIVGGVPPYSILWSNGENTPMIDSLTAGIYSVTVMDSIGCPADSAIIITEPEGIVATSTSTNITCHGAHDGTINLILTGGTAPYNILWSNGSTTANLVALAPGTYSVVVEDSAGCGGGLAVSISEPLPLTVDISKVDVPCFGALGSATANVSGGTAPYTYNWLGTGETGATANLPAGVYTLIVMDSMGCFTLAYVTILQLPAHGYTTASQDGYDVTCSANNMGCFLNNNFATSFPAGLEVGNCGRTLRLTSAAAVRAFFPSFGFPRVLPIGTLVNPTNALYKNILAAQTVALTLNVKFDEDYPSFSPSTKLLKDLIITFGNFEGQTVQQVLTEANNALGGCSNYSIIEISITLEIINRNFENGANLNLLAESCEEEGRTAFAGATHAPVSNDATSTLSAYPNPAVDNSVIEFSTTVDSYATVEVYNSTTGQLEGNVYSGMVNAGDTYSIPFNTANLRNGVYIVKMLTDQNVQTKQLVITK